MAVSLLTRLSVALLAAMLALAPALAVASGIAAMPMTMSEASTPACADCPGQPQHESQHGATVMHCALACFASVVVPAEPQLPSRSSPHEWSMVRSADPSGITSPLDPDPPNALR